MKSLTPAQFPEWLAQAGAERPGVKPVLLDVREPWECELASVPTDERFELVRMPMASVPARYGELDPQRPIACLCHHGMRSAQVAYFLLRQGFERVVNVHGGIHAWSLQCDPSIPTY
jgi:rhodanese-related sulfurtransferase